MNNLMDIIKNSSYIVRFFLELCCIASFSYWGCTRKVIGNWRYAIGIIVPVIFMVIWGSFGAPKAPYRWEGYYKLLLEISIFILAVSALYFSNQKQLSIVLGIVLFINTFLVNVL